MMRRKEGDKPQLTHAGIFIAVSALMMAHQVAGKASRDALYLSQFKAAHLPAMITVAALTGIAVTIMGNRMFIRLGPQRLAPVSFAASGLLQIAEWFLLGYSARLGACLVYLHIVAFGSLLLSCFWSLMNESFEPRSAKAFFGKVSGAGTLGGLCGGLLAERVAAWFGTRDVVMVLGALHLTCAGLLWTVTKVRRLRPDNRPQEPTPIEALQRYPFLLVLSGLVITASAGTALLDFVFKVQAAKTIGTGAPLLRFLGVYYTATSLMSLLLQTLLARVFVQRAGLAATVASLPACISLGSLTALVLPGFPVLAAVRATEIGVRGSFFRSGYELFYTAVPPVERRAVKSVIDVSMDKAGDAVGSAGVSLMLLAAPEHHGPVLALACVMSMVALLLAMRLRHGYLRALETSLVERGIELDPSIIDDSATRSVFMQSIQLRVPNSADRSPTSTLAATQPVGVDSFLRRAAELRSNEAARAFRAAAQVGPDDWALAPLLIDMLAWDEAMPAARDALKRIGVKITGMLVDALLDQERDFVIRRRVPRVLVELPSQRCADGLYAALDDPRFEVRFYAGRALFLLLRNHSHLSVPPERVWEAVNRELSSQGSAWNSRRLLDRRGAETQWFFDDELLDRADRNLEHLFTLLALLLPETAVRVAFRALHTNDAQLKGTAFEYLETATPPLTRQLLLPMLEAIDARAVENSLASR